MLQDISTFPGMLIIGSAPSGAGKNSIFQRVLELQSGLVVESVSCTTRKPRQGEVDGKDYLFLSPEEFERREAAGYFLESSGYVDRRYGTPMEPVFENLRRGVDVLLIIEVKGAAKVRGRVSDALTIFIMPAGTSDEERLAQLRNQLSDRASEDNEIVKERLAAAAEEMGESVKYDHVVINPPGKLDEAVLEVNKIINETRRNRQANLQNFVKV